MNKENSLSFDEIKIILSSLSEEAEAKWVLIEQEANPIKNAEYVLQWQGMRTIIDLFIDKLKEKEIF